MSQLPAYHSREGARPQTQPPAASPKGVSLHDAVAGYLGWLATTPDVRDATRVAYEIDVHQFLSAMSAFGPLMLAEIDERHVEAWKSTMTELKAVTVRRKLVALSGLFRWARRQRLVTRDPVEFVRKPRKVRQVQISLSLEHYETLLDACNTHMDRAMLGCLFWAGCRREEAADLTIGSVDIAAGSIRITGKGGDTRLVAMAPRLASLLAAHLGARRPGDLDEPLFPNRGGGRKSTKSVNRWFGGLCKRAELDQCHYTPHSARRGIAALMDAEGFSMFEIQAFLGHQDPRTTALYVQASTSTIRDRMADSPIFSEQTDEAIPADRVTRLEDKMDSLVATVSAFMDRLSPPAEEGLYPIGDAPQLRDAVGHER